MWWWRTVRRADIPALDRDTFERFGEAVIGNLLVGGFTPIAPELQTIYGDKLKQAYARDWLTERSDAHERREQRLETVEWAVLIFVALGVIVDAVLLVHH
jgi:hypothetical protein